MTIKDKIKVLRAGGIPDISYSDGSIQKLDLYIPTKNVKNKLILFIHGGGFIAGDKSNCIDYCKEYKDKGYYTASVNYTLLNGIANPSLNCIELSFAVAKIFKYVWEKQHIVLESMATYGVSAGSTLALLYAYKIDSVVPVKLAVGKVPPVTFNPTLWHGSAYFDGVMTILAKKGVIITDKEEAFNQYVCGGDWKSCSPVEYKPIPTMCMFGLKDEVVPQFNRESILGNMNENYPDTPFYYVDLPHSGHCCEKLDSPLEKEFNRNVDIWLEKYV